MTFLRSFLDWLFPADPPPKFEPPPLFSHGKRFQVGQWCCIEGDAELLDAARGMMDRRRAFRVRPLFRDRT